MVAELRTFSQVQFYRNPLRVKNADYVDRAVVVADAMSVENDDDVDRAIDAANRNDAADSVSVEEQSDDFLHMLDVFSDAENGMLCILILCVLWKFVVILWIY